MTDDPTRDALEAALAASPDDPAAFAAYADYLIERGDPRGEFVRVQLALEDESLPKVERDALRRQEAELLAAHQREWLGELADPLLGLPSPPPDPPHGRIRAFVTRVMGWPWNPLARRPRQQEATWEFRRGWLHRLSDIELTIEVATALRASPTVRLLHTLAVLDDPDDDYDAVELNAIAGGRFDNLRCFRLGPEPPPDGWVGSYQMPSGRDLMAVLAGFPRLDDLRVYTMDAPAAELCRMAGPRLRRFDLHRGHHFPLSTLADNPAFAALEHLDCFPHGYVDWEDAGIHGAARGSYLPLEEVVPLVRSPHLRNLRHLALRGSNAGDELIRHLLESGMLDRLRVLDLSHGAVTDAGADLLARSAAARRLERLDLSDNALSPAGVRRLREANVPVTANDQHDPGAADYLFVGEFE